MWKQTTVLDKVGGGKWTREKEEKTENGLGGRDRRQILSQETHSQLWKIQPLLLPA